MVLKTTPGANIPTYQVAGTNVSRIIPDWLIQKRKKSLKYDPEFANRLTLLQDFHFEEASNRIKVTNDGNFCMATGTYKPQIHVYDFNDLSLKFDRHTDAENVDFVLVSDDWKKSVHLQNDRTIEFHAQGGIHHRSRVPKFGRCLSYNPTNCDIVVGAAGNEVYRLNIDQGRFLAPFETDSEGVNSLDINQRHGLLACGMENSTVEFWDPRTRQRAAMVNVGGEAAGGVTSVKYRNDGLNFAAGTNEGTTYLFDLRSPEPLMTKDQGYGFPIKNIEFLDTDVTEDKVLTSDKRIVKIWDRNNGEAFTSFEPSVDINDVAVVPDSGMILLANEGQAMHAYYIPSLGPAPKWVPYLDNITEENEEKGSQAVYENLQFVTRKGLKELQLTHMIGTSAVKSYMHGYFITQKLYDEARAITRPTAHREYRDQEVRRKIEKQRESRIRSAQAAGSRVKVNKGLAAEMQQAGTGDALQDDRFKAMFEDPEFEVDERSKEFASKVRSAEQAEARRAGMAAKHGDVDGGESGSGSESESESGSNSDSEKTSKQLQREQKQKKQEERRVKQLQNKKQMAAAMPQPQMRAITTQSDTAAKSFGDQIEDNADDEQMREEEAATVRKGAGGGTAEFSYIPSKQTKKPKKVEFDEDDETTKDSGRKQQRHEGRRRASKNAFRGL